MTQLHVLSRRLFLWQLGKGAVAVAVLGSAAAACGDDDDAATTETEDTDAETGTGSDTETTGPGDAGDGETADGSTDLVWKRASLGFVSAWVLARGKEAAVVDTGTDEGEPKVAEALQAADLGWDGVRHVIVTHKHPDHAGGLKAVLGSATNATAWAGEADIAAIESPRKLEVAADGAEIFGLRVVATPGHTPGHICVYDPGAKLLVTGDAVIGEDGTVAPPGEQYTEDMPTAHASVKKLAGLAFDTVLFGHGEPIETGGQRAMETLAATLG